MVVFWWNHLHDFGGKQTIPVINPSPYKIHQFAKHPKLDTRISFVCSSSVLRPLSRSGYPPWILKRGGLKSSGQIYVSLSLMKSIFLPLTQNIGIQAIKDPTWLKIGCVKNRCVVSYGSKTLGGRATMWAFFLLLRSAFLALLLKKTYNFL